MLKLQMNIKLAAQIDTLIARYDGFSALKNMAIWEYERDELRDYLNGKKQDLSKQDWYRWTVSPDPFFDGRDEVSLLPVMFIGKTGYGKSSLLNSIVGKELFPTDDVSACTTQIDTALFRMGNSAQYYLSLCDLPGVGENEQADQRYMEWYTGLLYSCPCVVYALRADQRDYSVDEAVFRQLFANVENRDKVVIALTFADKIEPCHRGDTISQEQLESLSEKVDSIAQLFSIDTFRIIPCCAHTGYGLQELLGEIIDDLELSVFEE